MSKINELDTCTCVWNHHKYIVSCCDVLVSQTPQAVLPKGFDFLKSLDKIMHKTIPLCTFVNLSLVYKGIAIPDNTVSVKTAKILGVYM